MPGDTIGIIGKNGAGKSTLLKILSKITPPTSGKIIGRGRIASLLEVGTGFHPELSGRENIFMNGSILGMRRTEILKNFDAIIEFSGVEKFIDTPLKHYSSGMQLRLAFAVAAFLENEILIIDEVLAVGDVEFQKKCMGKMNEVSKSGRTILFVSHSMNAIQSLCKKGVLLEKGKTNAIEDISTVVSKYLYGDTTSNSVFVNSRINENKEAEILEARVLNTANELAYRFSTNELIKLEIKWINRGEKLITPNFLLLNQNGQKVMIGTDTKIDWDGSKKSKKGIYLSEIIIPKNLLNANEYFFHIALDSSSPSSNYDAHFNVFQITVFDPLDEGSIHRGDITIMHQDVSVWPSLESSFQKLS
ncbi:MAG: ABC transporter ATP-binding protein [Bacteroidetes bacterium]|nr:ABC transporter ATP-binding protein [Bacteroidota bacterium]